MGIEDSIVLSNVPTGDSLEQGKSEGFLHDPHLVTMKMQGGNPQISFRKWKRGLGRGNPSTKEMLL